MGRAIDLSGRTLAGLSIVVAGDPSPATAPVWREGVGPVTDREGRFSAFIRSEFRDASLSADHPTLVTVVEGDIVGTQGTTIVVAQPRSFAGRVVDADHGAPLAGARVSFVVTPRLFRDLHIAPTTTRSERRWSVQSDRDGRFELPRVPSGRHLMLRAEKQGFGSREFPAPEHSDHDLELALFNPAATVRGRVEYPDGRPAEGARVSDGTWVVTTRSDGSFELHGSRDAFDTGLCAVAEGFLPGRAMTDVEDPEPLVIRLGEAALTLDGRVVDSKGNGLSGITVWLEELHVLAESRLREPAVALEPIIRGSDQRGTTTDRRGHFRLEGLLPEEYVLRAIDPSSLVAAELDVTAGASEDVVVVLDDDRGLSAVAGFVHSTDGTPLEGVRVALTRDIGCRWNTIPLPDDGARTQAYTDEHGHFELAPVTRYGTHLALERPGFVAFEHRDLDGFEDLSSIRLELPPLCRLQVDLGSAPSFADSVTVADEEGECLPLIGARKDADSVLESAPFTDGKTDVFWVSKRARAITLHDEEGQVVLVRKVELDPAELVVVRP